MNLPASSVKLMDNWPFDDPPNVAALANLNRNQSVLIARRKLRVGCGIRGRRGDGR